MSSNSACTQEPPRKKIHLDDASKETSSSPSKEEAPENNGSCGSSGSANKFNGSTKEQEAKENEQATAAAADFSQLEIVRVLSNTDANCSVAVEAKHKTEDGRVLLHLQKSPFNVELMSEVVSGGTRLRQLLHNDVYSKHTAALPVHLNEVSVTIIHPATDKHFERYERELCSMVEETPELYAIHSKPFIDSGSSFSKQWIYNILEGSSEADRVIFRDDDPLTGFVLVPDLKWTGLQLTDLYCQAIVVRRDVSTIRDLNGDHLPLLRNIRDLGTKAIEEKYGVERHRLRVYVHYLPSYYHFHVHFAALTYDAPGTWCGRAHLLSDVISNLEQSHVCYSRATLSFVLKDNHPHPLALKQQRSRDASSPSPVV